MYIALESKKAPEEKQDYVRKMGIFIAIILRLILLFLLVNLVEKFKNTIIELDTDFIKLNMNLHSLIILFGGGFILYTSIKEIWHMIILKLTKFLQKSSTNKLY